MGNAPSSHSSDGCLRAPSSIDYSSSESLRFASDDNIVLGTPGAQLRLRPEAQLQLKERLFEASRDMSGANSPTKPGRLNTSQWTQSSMTLSSAPTSPIATRTMVSIEATALILTELKKFATSEDLRVLQQILQAPDETALETDISKQKADDDGSRPTPYRRCSLRTPGLATRNGPPNLLKKSPPNGVACRKKSQHHTWSPEMFGESPLAKLAGLGVDIDRAATPANLDISYLGVHKLGSLQVINGAATPEPSIRSASPVRSDPMLLQEDDSFTEEDTEEPIPKMPLRLPPPPPPLEPEMPLRLAPSPPPGPEMPLRLPPPPPGPEMPSRRPPSPPRSPLNGPRCQPLSRKETSASTHSNASSVAQQSPSQRMYRIEAKSNPFLPSTYDDDSAYGSRKSSETSSCSKPSSTGCPSSLHHFYRTEGNSNPFLPASVDEDSAEDEVEDQDNCSEDEEEDLTIVESRITPSSAPHDDDQSVYSLHDTLLENSSSVRKQRPKSLDPMTLRQSQGTNMHDSSFPARDRSAENAVGGSAEKTHRPRLNADSGYGSQSSIYTLYEKQTLDSGPVDPSNQHEHHAPVGRSQSSLELCRDVPSIPYSSTATAGSRFYEYPQVSFSNKQLPPSPRKAPGFYKLGGKAASTPNLAMKLDTPPNTPTSKSEKSTPRKTSPRKKLQKKRGLPVRISPTPLVVPRPRVLSGIPTVPMETLSKHADRMTRNPGMDSLEHTYKSVSHLDNRSLTEHDDTEPIELKFPSPSPSPSPGKKRRSSYGQYSGIRIFSGKTRRSRDFGVDRAQYHSDDFHASVADFGTVAGSLGASPYDIANAPDGPRTQQAGPGRPAHPHQISIGRRRSKSAVGMDERQASAFAMSRSRDRIANQDPLEVNGFYGMPSDSLETLPSRKPWSNAQVDPPPVPLLPTSGNARRPQSYQDEFGMAGHWRGSPQKQKFALRLPPRLSPEPREHRHDAQEVSRDDSSIPNERDGDWDWEAQKRAWRARRKSIGEGLLQPHPAWDQASGVPAPWSHNDYKAQPRPPNSGIRTGQQLIPRKPTAGAVAQRSQGYGRQELRLPPSGRPPVSNFQAQPQVTPVAAFLSQNNDFSLPSVNSRKRTQPPPRVPSPSILARVAIFDRPAHQMR